MPLYHYTIMPLCPLGELFANLAELFANFVEFFL
jgi:hypothetical protein